ncbi:ninjurin-A isoform X1 [Helicoverpa armigera]|uniref:ninjurin-A isoform X1 n=1 Tax=Helicoverpa armigera TaxID=29058 RepID=UPI003082D092
MAKDNVKLDIVNEKNDVLLNDIIEIFGRPVAPVKPPVTNNVRPMDLERGLDTQFSNNNLGESDATPTQPLLEPPRDRQLPPLAGPEIDDLDGDPPKDATPYPGIDDGLFEPIDKNPENHDHDHDGSEHPTELDPSDKHSEPHDGDDGGATDGKLPWEHDEPDYPYVKQVIFPDELDPYTLHVNGIGTRFGDSRPGSPMPGSIPDVNTYQQKKNLAQGMMDLALLSANANQLRYVLESSTEHSYYYPSLIFISLSIIFQVMVGIGLIMNSRYDVNDHKERCKADKINNLTVLGIFLITIVNVFITSFSVNTPMVTKTVVATPPSV